MDEKKSEKIISKIVAIFAEEKCTVEEATGLLYGIRKLIDSSPVQNAKA